MAENHKSGEETIFRRTPRSCVANRKYHSSESDDEEYPVPVNKIKSTNVFNDCNRGSDYHHKRGNETENTIDDFVAIGKGSYKKMWKFPMTNRCPNKKCTVRFASRSAAMTHYQECHADSAILCEVCDKPIASHNGPQHIIDHFKRIHPYDPLPAFISQRLSTLNNDSRGNPDESIDRRPVKKAIRAGRTPSRPSQQCQSNQQRPSNCATENDVVKIIVDVRDYSELQVNVKDNRVIIEATNTESNERTTIKKHLLYDCAIKDNFEPSGVTSNLSSDRMLSVLVPMVSMVSGRVFPVKINNVG